MAAGALDNMVIDSDKLALLGPEEKNLFRRALGLRGGRARVRGLMGEFGEDVYLIEAAGGKRGDVRLAANLSDGERTIEGRTVAPRSILKL